MNIKTYCPLPKGKLIRFKIPELQEKEFGVKVTTEEINPHDPRAVDLFSKKIHEELTELSNAPEDKKPEEVADVLTVLQDILKHQVISINSKLLEAAFQVVDGNNPIRTQVNQILTDKRNRNGDFSKLIIVINETSPTQNP